MSKKFLAGVLFLCIAGANIGLMTVDAGLKPDRLPSGNAFAFATLFGLVGGAGVCAFLRWDHRRDVRRYPNLFTK